MVTGKTDVEDGSARGILSRQYVATTVAAFALIAFAAFESLAVTTVMPTIARELDGFSLFALAFAAPLASGVVGMVVAGAWSDRSGPAAPMLVSLGLFSAGLLVCGLSPTMEVLLAGRVLQGLGGGAMVVGLYVIVGIVFPDRLQPAIFATFAAAWELPALFGPGLAALIATQWSWRWVFVGVIAFVALALVLLTPALRHLPPHEGGEEVPASRLGWALVGATAVLGLELLGSSHRPLLIVGAGVTFLVVLLALHRMLPDGTLAGRRGLPSVIATRGLLSGCFFSIEAYIVYVLQDHWSLTPGRAGIALTLVGIVWATASQAQSRLGDRVSHTRAMVVGTTMVVAGAALLTSTVAGLDAGAELPSWVPVATYVLAGAGMGFAYPRTSVATLAASTHRDRGANSSSLNVADSLGAALALSLSGIAFETAERGSADPFLVVFVLAATVGLLAVLTARRTTQADI